MSRAVRRPLPWQKSPHPPPPLPPALPDGSPWPRISIVTPSYNQGDYLEQTLLSVAQQGYPNVEHLVIDGGSSDDSPAILARWRERLAHVVSEPDRGQSHALNKGFARASGEILTWLNADDLLAPGALAAVALAFHTSGADLVAGIACLFDDDGLIERHFTCCPDGLLPLGDLLDLDGGWHAGKFFYQPEVMFSRAIWERAGAAVREDLRYSMDYDLWVRFAEQGARLHAIGRPVAWFRVHAAQKTSAVDGFRGELEAYRRAYAKPAPPPAPRRPRRAGGALRVVFLNDHGFNYGAGIAHERLAEAVAAAGHEVRPLALFEADNADSAFRLPTPDELRRAVAAVGPDLVVLGNLHAANAEPRYAEAATAAAPTLAVLHDFWWLTGRCAYPEACESYRAGCHAACPTPHEYPALAPERIA
ncbi:MAG: glycosyltransferase, partial [Thermoanaerobaculia bacterium]|nr:glycosyltransferase [Thermoanaerobaculia bacterium]